MASTVQEAFDRLAPAYAADFTASFIGRLQREAVWRLLDEALPASGRLLDLGCGDAPDAIRFAQRGYSVDGIDISPEMIRRGREAVEAASLDDQLVNLEPLALEDLDRFPDRGYDGAYSNFSALNCVADLRPVAQALAERLKPGAPAALCLMSRSCLWETLLYPLTHTIHGGIRRSSKAWAPTETGAGEVPLYYRSITDVARTFRPEFRLERAPGVGVSLPPVYLEPVAERLPRLMRLLAAVDRPLGSLPLIRGLAEHRVVILRRE